MVTITLPRSVARPLGILDREDGVRLTSRDKAWLVRNVKDRMKPHHQKALREALVNAGVTL